MNGGLLGRSPGIERAREHAALVAPLRDPVVIIGETGTGKGVLARLIHQLGHASTAPFQSISGPELAEGLFQSQLFGHVKGAFSGADTNHKGRFASAAGGTLFVDELHLMPSTIQAAFLRALQDRQWIPLGGEVTQIIACRFIAAVQRPLEELVSDGSMLADLRYRLGEFLIELPPLRDRIEDLPALAANALRGCFERYFEVFGVAPTDLAPDALVALVCSPWPGNVRELESVVTRAAATAAKQGTQLLTQADLPDRFHHPSPPLSIQHRQVVVEWYFGGESSRFTRTELATAMGVSPGTVDNDRHALAASSQAGQDAGLHRAEDSCRCRDTGESSQRGEPFGATRSSSHDPSTTQSLRTS